MFVIRERTGNSEQWQVFGDCQESGPRQGPSGLRAVPCSHGQAKCRLGRGFIQWQSFGGKVCCWGKTRLFSAATSLYELTDCQSMGESIESTLNVTYVWYICRYPLFKIPLLWITECVRVNAFTCDLRHRLREVLVAQCNYAWMSLTLRRGVHMLHVWFYCHNMWKMQVTSHFPCLL